MSKTILIFLSCIFYQYSFAQIDGAHVNADFPNNFQCYTDISKHRSQHKLNNGCPFLSVCDDSNLRDEFLDISSIDTLYFQLRWNIIRNDLGATNFTDTAMNAMMSSLNLNFTSAKIQFIVDTINYVNNDELYYIDIPNQFTDYDAEDLLIKETAGGDYDKSINIYIIDNDFGNAYAYYPWLAPANPGDISIRSGAVLFTNPTYLEENPNLLTHEMGHVFGLLHVFEGFFDCDDCHEYGDEYGNSVNGDMAGDFISDTNPSPIIPICEEVSFNDPCTDIPYAQIPFENVMSYSDCREQITPQQIARMHCMINQHLTNWILNETSVSTQQAFNPNVKLFPNPVSEQLFVTGAPGNIPFIIYSLNGQKLKNGRIDNIITSELPDGIYVLQLLQEGASNQIHLFNVN